MFSLVTTPRWIIYDVRSNPTSYSGLYHSKHVKSPTKDKYKNTPNDELEPFYTPNSQIVNVKKHLGQTHSVLKPVINSPMYLEVYSILL